MTINSKMSGDDVRDVLTGVHPGLAHQRDRFRRFPSDPRCKLCNAPFGGIGGAVFARMGFGRSAGNPALCNACVSQLRRSGMSGVEIPLSMVFTDVRGSTAMAERMRPTEFHAFLELFYRLASSAIVANDGLVDKVVGDEVIGLFFGGVSGPNHAAKAIAAARAIALGSGRPDATPSGPIPAGTAVHTGEAFVGATGPAGMVDDFTALGDAVNTTARLASAAGAGEVLVSAAAAAAAELDTAGFERRSLDIRGRQEPIDVLVLTAATGSVPAG